VSPEIIGARMRMLEDPVQRLRLAVVLLVVLAIAGTVGYHWIAGLDWFDAFYMTLITVSTVGFSEIGDLNFPGRVFTAFLIMGGIFLVTFSVGSFLETIVEGELAQFFGRRRLEQRISALDEHWIICGYGRMGEQVTREMNMAKRPVPFVVIDTDLERVLACEEAGHLYVQADATDEECLERAGIQRARGLVSLVASDAENVFICLTARQIAPHLKIVARSLETRSEAKLRQAGADKVISPYNVGGHRLSQAVLQPVVAEFLEFAASHDLQLELEQSEIRRGSALVGLALRDSGLRNELDLIVLAIRRADGGMLFNPGADTVLEAGDTLIAMGHGASLVELGKRAAGDAPSEEGVVQPG